MNKMLLSLIVGGFIMSTSAMATLGKINSIVTTSDGVTKVRILKDGTTALTQLRPILGTAEAQKAMLAIILTAKSQGVDVDLILGSYGGDNGWIKVTLP